MPSKGTEEFRVGEIFLSANAGNEAQASPMPTRSSSSCATARRSPATPGNIRKLRPPRSAAISAGSAPSNCPSRLRPTLRHMGPGQVSNPIPVQGGISIVAVQDTRKVLTADPRDAVLSLKQVSVMLPEGHHAGRRRSRSSPASPRPRAPSAAAAAPTRSRPISMAKSSRATRPRFATCPRAAAA